MKKKYIVPQATIVAAELHLTLLAGSHDIQEGWAEAKRNDNLWDDDFESQSDDEGYTAYQPWQETSEWE